MANTITKYTDSQIMKALLTRDFSGIGGEFVDDMITSVKAAAFMGAANLTKVSLPNLKEVRYQAFANTSIANLDIPWSKLESLGGGAFMGASGLPQDLVLPKATAINSSVFAGTSSARNTQIRSVSLPVWTGSTLTEQGFSSSSSGLFAYCSALTRIEAPMLQTMPNQMLYYCAALEEVNFPKVSTVNSGAFAYCTKLKKIDLGGPITRLSSTIFSNCSALQAIILRGVTTVPTLSTTVFSSTNVSKKTAYIYVPKALEETFKVAANWSTYATQIRAIEDYPDICGS